MTQINLQNTRPTVANLAGLTEQLGIFGDYWVEGKKRVWKYTLSWGDLFALIAPYLLENPNDIVIKKSLAESLFEKTEMFGNMKSINDQNYQTIKVQLMALGLVDVKYSPTVQG